MSFGRKVARRGIDRGPAILRKLPALFADLQRKVSGIEARAAAGKMSAGERDAAADQQRHVRELLAEPALPDRSAWSSMSARLERLAERHVAPAPSGSGPRVTFKVRRMLVPGAPEGARCEACESPACVTLVADGERTHWCGEHGQDARPR